MNPVDAEVGEDEEKRELENVVEGEGGVRGGVVEFGVAPDFNQEKRAGKDGHDWHGAHRLLHFEPDLIFEVLGVRESGVIED